MSTTFEPLVTDYEVKWDEISDEDRAAHIPEGKIFEHGLVELDNGYVVSVLRSNLPGHETKGNEAGLWEAVATRVTTNPLMQALGMDRQPAPELNHLHNYQYAPELEGPWVAGDLDSQAFNAFVASVQAAPPYEGDADDGSDLISMLFGGAE